ncbi:MAG: hypothetical protein KGL39_51510 [Patescibacteria group bacterium]|nr:hypothetical protein [Patescibacteria group bacterium]
MRALKKSGRSFNPCAICAHDIKTPACPHPWKQPFEKWPEAMRNQLRRLVPCGWDAENRKGA